MNEPFSFKGTLGASKSLYNRALILKSFFPEVQIVGQSQSQDVVDLQRALWMWEQGLGQELDCGEGGTTLRFLLARVSREVGNITLTGKSRLFERPHHELSQALEDLGVGVRRGPQTFHVESKGWRIPTQGLVVDYQLSSQFVSAILLSAWLLPQDLTIELHPGVAGPSWSYLQMTLAFLQRAGMQVSLVGNKLQVAKMQKCQVQEIRLEPDMSSAFALAACAAGCGQVEIHDFPQNSLQPDAIFVKILGSMGVALQKLSESVLSISQTSNLRPVELNLEQNPDLFPVLAILAAQAQGVSRFSGLHNLKHKESDRLSNTQSLLSKLGYRQSLQNKVLLIEGEPNKKWEGPILFDPDGDHRMAMAAAVARCFGAPISILQPEVVKKSFPEFWEILG